MIAVFAADQAQAIAQRLEQMGREGMLDGAEELFQQLNASLAELHQALLEWSNE